MAVIITKQTEVDNYFDLNRLSQSKLKLLLKGFSHFLSNQKDEKVLYYEEKDYFIIGSAVDCILTGEQGIYDKLYFTSKLLKKPSDAEMSIINQVFDELVDNEVEVDLSLVEYPNMLEIAIKDQQWYKGNPGPKRTLGLIERCTPYFEDLKSSIGKQIVSSDQKALIDNIVMSLSTNPRTSKYFDREAQSRHKNIDFYYQLPIYFEHEGLECKALLDLLVVIKNGKGEIISLEPIDLKTMYGGTLSFINNIKKHRYDIQAAWYTLALEKWLENQVTAINVEIQNFKFIVESNSFVGVPVVYQLTDDVLAMGINGKPETEVVTMGGDFQFPIIYKEIKGFDKLVEEYKFYEETEWKEDITLAGNPEIIKLSWNGVINN